MTSYLLVPRRWWHTRPPVAQFPFRFVVLLVPVLVLVPRVVEYGPTAVDLTTSAVGWAASSLGLSAAASSGGRMTFADGAFWYDVIPACTTAVSSMLFVVLVVAYPATWRQRVIGVSFGIPALFAFNLVRLVVLAWFGVHAMATYNAVHWVGFQALFVFVVGLLWAGWIRLIVEPNERTRPLMSQMRRGWWRAPAIFVGSFAVLGFLASLGPVQRTYARVFAVPFELASAVLWRDYDVPYAISTGDFFAYPVAFAAFVSLFLATRRHAMRERVSGISYPLIPVLFATQFVDVLVGKGLMFAAGDPHLRDGIWGAESAAISRWVWEGSHIVLLAVVPFLCWLMWSRKQANGLSEAREPNERQPNVNGVMT